METLQVLTLNIIYIIQSKVFFYLVIGTFTISNIIYRKTVKEIRTSLNITEHMFSGEKWDMIKEERDKGNKKAKIAFFAYYLEMACLFLVMCIFLSINI